MKTSKTLFLSLVFALGLGLLPATTQAITQEYTIDDNQPQNPDSFWGRRVNEQKLNDAITRRHQNYYSKYILRNREEKNRLNQKAKHRQARYNSNASQVSTQMNRKGALTDVPFYKERRPDTKTRYTRRNAKQVFRARAIDYYINGGYAGAEAIDSGLIRSSEYRINRVPIRQSAGAVGAIIKPVRDLIRNINPNQGQGNPNHNRRSYNRGDYRRFFTHPFSPKNFFSDEGLEQFKAENGGFYSTEAPRR